MNGRGFEFGWEKRFGFGWEKGFDIQWYGMEMEKPEGAACEQACRGKDGRMHGGFFLLLFLCKYEFSFNRKGYKH
jgi:hypothetical protein